MESAAWHVPDFAQPAHGLEAGVRGAIPLHDPYQMRLRALSLAKVNGHHQDQAHIPWCLSWTRRIIEVVLAGSVLLLIAPLFVLTALAIVVDSRGPVFFRQWRTGYAGKRFQIFKFRTMVADAEELKEALRHLSHHGPDSPDFKIRNDPRVTRVGRILRRLSLDEFPNLINVVIGDMSLVGPRPTSFDVDQYDDWHLERLVVPPGVTGLWQISGRSDIDFDERVRLDCRYIREQSFLLDVKIILLTPFRVFGGKGAC